MRRISEKQALFAKYYYTPGLDTFGNGGKAYMLAYPKCKSDKAAKVEACRLLTNPKIIAMKEQIQAKNNKKLDNSRESCLKVAVDIMETGTDSNKLRAAVLIGQFCGFIQDNAPNSEKEAAIAARMSAEEREQAATEARARTDELSKPILAKEIA